jgi:hypothetical protein
MPPRSLVAVKNEKVGSAAASPKTLSLLRTIFGDLMPARGCPENRSNPGKTALQSC